ncbi:MAG: hypothetical protein IE880_09255, partial [Epsilonproteobacteria bacterium]|nr:hypothetical protein [Campylobacterota bacterium]
MRQLQKQIEITKKQKQELETVNRVIDKNISTMQSSISLIEEENNSIAFEIGNYSEIIKQLPKDFQPTFLQILIQIVSFGTKNYKKDYISHLETLNSKRDKLTEKLSSREQNIKDIQNNFPEELLQSSFKAKVVSGHVDWKNSPILLKVEQIEANQILF